MYRGNQRLYASGKLESGKEMVPLQGAWPRRMCLQHGQGLLHVDFLSAKHVPKILCGVPQRNFFWLASIELQPSKE